ncbi:MAG TPA: C25 family cysteine peptidase, partial [Anaerolineales bacterium]|nr:C25 family cysteine peptidase [Anaerolineales bacterium]
DRYDRISFSGQSGLTADPGAPQLPFYSFIVAVPAHAEVTLLDLTYETTVEPGTYAIAPAPAPKPPAEDLTPGAFEAIQDPARYRSSAAYPAKAVQLADEAWVRGQRVLRVIVYPFQYNPAGGRLTVNTDFQFRIAFTGDLSETNCGDCRYSETLETALQEQLVNYEQGLTWRVAPGSEALAAQIQSPEVNPFLGPRFEIIVNRDGVYHLTYADLQAAGMNVDNVNPQTFRLVNQGQDVAIHVLGEGDGSFDSGDFVAFYGERFRGDVMQARYQSTMTKPTFDPYDQSLAPNNWFWKCWDGCELAGYFERYTENNVYYLLSGGPAGPRMDTAPGAPGGAPIAESYLETVRAEEAILWWSHEFYDQDIWYWERIQTITPRNFPITLTDLAPSASSATVTVEISSRGHNADAAPDHHSRISLNGVLLDDTFWDGRIRYAFTGPISHSDLDEGANTLTLTMLNDAALPNPDVYFDFFEVTYAREFVAMDDQLAFSRSQSGSWRFQITGLSSGAVEVYRITNPLSPVRITGATVNAGTATFQVTDGASSRYVVAGTGAGILTPESISLYDPPDFDAMAEAEYVLITHTNFLPAAQTLANYRSGQGYSVAVIDVADLYREFNDGIYHPIAIKNFLAWTFQNWSEPVRYAVLIGNGNWNMRNFGDGSQDYHNAPPTFMPPNLAYVDPWQGEVDSSNLLATIVGNDVVPDVHIGRMPVQTNTELATLVNKIIDYETAPYATWKNNILFIADNIPDLAGNFIALTEGIISDYVVPHPPYTPVRIYQDDGDGIPNGFDFGCTSLNTTPNECQAVTDAIIAQINAGVLIVNYTGHASINRWSGESIFLKSDIPSLNNPTRLPFVMSMTCLDGHWTYPNSSSLAYLFLTTPGKGAVGTFSATGLGVASGHDPLQRGFYGAIMGAGNWQAGPAADAGKLLLWGGGNDLDLAQTFMIFGDPALGLESAYNLSLTPPTSETAGAAGTVAIHTLTVKNTGAGTDTYTIVVNAGDWGASASQQTVGPLAPNQTAQVHVTVSIPINAIHGADDVTIVTAISNQDIHRSALAQLTTTSLGTLGESIFLPVIIRE